MTTYKDLFESPEELVERRLEETAGNYSETLKEAGYKYIWDAFVKRAMDEGFYEAYRGAQALDKVASDDEFVQGQNEALMDIENLNPEWYEFLKEANDAVINGGTLEDFCKEAQNQEFANYVLNVDEDLMTIAFKQPEKTNMNSYDFGKEAALNDMIDLYEMGYGYSDVIGEIQDTLNQELNKYASQEDVDVRLGIEGACHQFLKEASELFGDYDTSNLDDNEVLYYILEKVAADDKPSMRERAGAAYGRAKERYHNLTPRQKAGLAAAGALGTAGAAYGGYRAYQHMQDQQKNAMNYEVAEALAVLEAYGFEPEFE